MQFRFPVNVSPSEYVRLRLWEKVRLKQCPFHPNGGCGVSKHGTYTRKWPIPLKIRRWYCLKAHATISFLPDFLACRLSGTLQDVEEVVLEVQKYPNLEMAAASIRADIELPGAIRWLRRRLNYVKTILTIAGGIFPQYGPWDIHQLKEFFALAYILPHLREILNCHLHVLPSIIGLSPPMSMPVIQTNSLQHKKGARKPP